MDAEKRLVKGVLAGTATCCSGLTLLSVLCHYPEQDTENGTRFIPTSAETDIEPSEVAAMLDRHGPGYRWPT
jgi:hypothetical protein